MSNEDFVGVRLPQNIKQAIQQDSESKHQTLSLTIRQILIEHYQLD